MDESGDETDRANEGEGSGEVGTLRLESVITGDGSSERTDVDSSGSVCGTDFGESPRLARYCEISGGNSTVLSATCCRRLGLGSSSDEDVDVPA